MVASVITRLGLHCTAVGETKHFPLLETGQRSRTVQHLQALMHCAKETTRRLSERLPWSNHTRSALKHADTRPKPLKPFFETPS